MEPPAVGLPGFSSLEDPQEPLEGARTGLGLPAGTTSPQSSLSAPSSASDGTPWGDGPAAADSEGPWSDPESAGDVDEPRKRSGSSRTSSSAEVKANQAALEGMVGQGVEVAGNVAHTYATRDELERHFGLYLTDEQDQAGIAKPAARLLSRHTGGDLANPDLNDGLGILMALANYVIKQVVKLKDVRLARDELAGTLQQPVDEQQAAA
jgi:hypothetical protein